MPFEERNGEVRVLLGYGKQKHPETGSDFFHHGVDFATNRYILVAVADGTVTGIGTRPTHGLYLVIRYGEYEVTYAHLAHVLASFGTKVKAGSVVAVSGKLLHVETKYNGEEIDPIDFLTMIYGNLKMTAQGGNGGLPEIETLETDIPTDYDDDRQEVEELMLRFYPEYLSEVADGLYAVPERTEQSLRNIFSLSAVKSYFYETIPSLANPLGIGGRCLPVAVKVQNLLIEDFLNYLALRHRIFLSTWSESDKKKVLTGP